MNVTNFENRVAVVTGRFDELTDDDIDAVIDVHLKAGFYVGQPALAAMKRQRYGRGSPPRAAEILPDSRSDQRVVGH
jgi:NAD(P)-dependent dehydrogenase (short-subunit alcohol dehydrogenase family)